MVISIVQTQGSLTHGGLPVGDCPGHSRVSWVFLLSCTDSGSSDRCPTHVVFACVLQWLSGGSTCYPCTTGPDNPSLGCRSHWIPSHNGGVSAKILHDLQKPQLLAENSDGSTNAFRRCSGGHCPNHPLAVPEPGQRRLQPAPAPVPRDHLHNQRNHRDPQLQLAPVWICQSAFGWHAQRPHLLVLRQRCRQDQQRGTEARGHLSPLRGRREQVSHPVHRLPDEVP